MLLRLSKTPKVKKSGSIKLRVTILIMVTLLSIPLPGYADDLKMIKDEVKSYIEAVHKTRTLKDYHYFEGEAGESELELELKVCASLGIGANSDQCIAFTRCRWQNREHAPSYYFVSLSHVLPREKIEDVWVEEGDARTLPHFKIHARIGQDIFTFFRPSHEDNFVPFGRLKLIMINGQPFTTVVKFNSIGAINQDSCKQRILKSR